MLNHDGTDLDFLSSEGDDDADTLVAALDSDEKSLLVTQLAKGIGATRTIAVVENGDYADIFERVGTDVDVTMNPRQATAEEIVRLTQGNRTTSQIENLSLLEDQQAEVLEIEVDADSVLTGRPLRDAVAELPEPVVLGAVIRDGEFVVPRGDTVVEPGGHVVLFVAVESVSAVTAAL